MRIKSNFFLRSLFLAWTTLLLLAAMPSHAFAAFILTFTQSGGDVIVNGSGTLNLSGLTAGGNITNPAFISPSPANLLAGPSSSGTATIYAGGGLTGPTTFGSGGGKLASSGTGSFVGINGSDQRLYAPQNYVSGTMLTTSSTYAGQTFTTLGFAPGTYTYTWGTGANADSLTITGVVPEPSTFGLFIAGSVSLLCVAFRRRRV